MHEMENRKGVIFIVSVLFLAVGAYWYYSRDTSDPANGSLDYEILVEGLDVPWSMDIASDGRIFFTERGGKVRLLEGGKVFTVYTLEVKAQENVESGLLGLVLHPKFPEDSRMMIYYTYIEEDGNPWNRISWFNYSDMELHSEEVFLDKIPAGNIHDGGRIKFGSNGKLYVTTGETGNGELAQDLNSLAGKILRYNVDGTIPEDNPFENSPVYSYGHRNPQGLAWHPETGELYSTEHGPSGENLWFAHDEINLIIPGANYGWPQVIGNSDNLEFTDPIYHTGDDTWAPSGATFLDKPDSSWHERLFVANLRGTSIRMIYFTPPDYTEISLNTPIFEDFGRIRTVVQGPDDFLYFCTSNRDGRGNPGERDDMIVRIIPP